MGKTFLLSLFLLITLIGALIRIIIKMKKNSYTVKDVFVESKSFVSTLFFFVITILIYLPCSLFLANAKDMLISFWRVFPLLLIPAIIFFIWSSVVLIALGRKVSLIIGWLIFGLTISIYIQSNFLNFHMPILSGNTYSFFDYPLDVIISILAWVILFLISGFIFVKKIKIAKIVAYVLSFMQIVSLIALIIVNSMDSRPIVATTTKGEFELGSEENVILFIMDSIEGHTVEEYIRNNSKYDSILSDFTLFTEAMGGGAPTQLGMPVILTGSEYDAIEDPDEYFDSVWEDTKLYNKLREENFDIRFYCTPGCVRNLPLGYVENIVLADDIYYIPEPLKYLEKIYTLSALYGAPQILKSQFMLNTSDFEWLLGLEGDNHIYFSEPRSFNNYWQETDGIDTSYTKAFRYYHLDGVHLPVQWNENLEFDESATWDQAFEGQMRLIMDYIESMKSAGIYDDALIVICGDHGQESDNSARINPAVIIKQPGENHEIMQYNSSPVTMRNLYSTIATIASKEKNIWGPTLYDIDESSNQQRLHTVSDQMVGALATEGTKFNSKYARVFVEDTYSKLSDAEIWNPYFINNYEIDMNGNSEVSISGDGNIPENTFASDGKLFLSNEFTCCIKINNNTDKDLIMNLNLGSILGGFQDINVWVNGHRLANNESNGAHSYIIPKSIVEDDTLYVRLVMPMALTHKMTDESSDDTRVMSVELKSISLSYSE